MLNENLMNSSIRGKDDSKRNERLDIIKGLLIILVVLGHSNSFLTRWIYSFHMAAFFAISGFLWNDRVLENKESIVRFLKKRIQRLYIPFVVVNCLFIILNNTFIKIGLYTTSQSFAEVTANWPVDQISTLYSVKQIALFCLESVFLVSGHAPIVGVSWFLATLFIISVIHLFVQLIISRFYSTKQAIVLFFIASVCLIISYFKEPIFGNIRGGGLLNGFSQHMQLF